VGKLILRYNIQKLFLRKEEILFMAIIQRKRNDTIYVCEKKYIGIKDGKRKYKEKCLGKLDKNGNFVSRIGLRQLPAEIVEVTRITKTFRVVEKIEKTSETQKEKIFPE